MLSDDMLRFVFVYDARFADALVGILGLERQESDNGASDLIFPS